MPRTPLLLVILFVFLLPLGAWHVRPEATASDLAAPHASDEVLVRLRPPFDRLDDAAIERMLRASLRQRLREIGWLRLQLEANETPAQAVQRLSRQPQVERVEPNHLLRSQVLPNDPLYSAQSGYLELIEAPAAWDIEQGQSSVLVAILDSGIDLSHPDLQTQIWSNELEIAGNSLDDDGNGCIDDTHGCSFVSSTSSDPSCPPPVASSVQDDNGHGSFVAGIVAAAAGNGVGISGAAPGVRLVPVKILDCLGSGTAADAAQGLLYAARVGARVANISFAADGESQTLASAMREASRRFGMVIVAATGNDGRNRVSFPARLPEAMAVGSSGMPNDPDARSLFSDWGPSVSVAAPGLNIVSTVPQSACQAGWFCLEGQPYAVASGTSFAAPFVSALAALLVSRTPNLSPEVVRRLIESTAQPLPDAGAPSWDGHGRIRMRKALDQPRFYLGIAGVSRQ